MPIITPILLGNFVFIKAGISTFPKVIAVPTKAAPTNSVVIDPNERTPSPIPNKIKESNKTSSIPNRCEKRGIKLDSSPKATKGIVVNIPAAVLDKDKLRLISPITGPTEVSGARRLAAKKITPRMASVFLVLVVLRIPLFGITVGYSQQLKLQRYIVFW